MKAMYSNVARLKRVTATIEKHNATNSRVVFEFLEGYGNARLTIRLHYGRIYLDDTPSGLPLVVVTEASGNTMRFPIAVADIPLLDSAIIALATARRPKREAE